MRWTRTAAEYASCAFGLIAGGATMVSSQCISHFSTVQFVPGCAIVHASRFFSNARTFLVTAAWVFPRT
ncbi:hypothetical protein BG845_01683 [Pseudonocardia autotrophica]|uniref:Uncharacterized protein n=1 Tax=Pseudonocardia autotrophica TaxID=2074 RepID=A0A1Y2N3Y9_PSEAH|nr:hypothetical protein BG845_01683 [Pseudonocardia autotrophica]